MTLFQTRGLTIGYSKKTVLDKIDFSLSPGEVCCVLGANGAGKSTFLKTLMGLQSPLAGEVFFADRPLSAYTPAELARAVAYVPQAHSNGFAFSVEDMVLMGRSARLKWYATPSREDHDAAQAALEQMGIAHLARRFYPELSGGEKQLVLIARAIAGQARVLIMDEPTASLDFGNQIRVLEKIRELKASSMALIVTTHNPQHARYIAETVAIVDRTLGFAQGPAGKFLTTDTLSALYRIDPAILKQHLGGSL